MKNELIALLREEINLAKRQLNEFRGDDDADSMSEPPITPEERGISDVGGMTAQLIDTIAEQGQEALEMAVGMFDEAGMLDAMCATTQGTMGFREDLQKEIANVLKELDDAEFGFGPDNPERIEYPERRLDVEGEAGVKEVMDNAVHRAKMMGMSQEDLADLFTDAVYASYEENT